MTLFALLLATASASPNTIVLDGEMDIAYAEDDNVVVFTVYGDVYSHCRERGLSASCDLDAAYVLFTPPKLLPTMIHGTVLSFDGTVLKLDVSEGGAVCAGKPEEIQAVSGFDGKGVLAALGGLNGEAEWAYSAYGMGADAVKVDLDEAYVVVDDENISFVARTSEGLGIWGTGGVATEPDAKLTYEKTPSSAYSMQACSIF
ncbi:MAG: hypothetical protein EP330_26320 [Deltaproteobacteria bacterium]|nr:MAG: hypothetical protein EP330_26320 [Deltaproteobacteria bacterium]